MPKARAYRYSPEQIQSALEKALNPDTSLSRSGDLADAGSVGAALGAVHKDLDDLKENGTGGGIKEETDPTVPAWAKEPEKPKYTAEEVGARPSTWTPSAEDVGADARGTADSKVAAHNTSDASHNDIRLLITSLTTRLNALANSTDEDLDQLAEIVAYIKANKSLIDSITTSKVNVADIIDNLTTSVSNKPLSAKMGVELKKLIDAIKIPTTLPASDVYSWAKQPQKPTYTAGEVGAASAEKVAELSEAIEDLKTLGLGVHTDGKVYIYKNGVPFGDGIKIASGGDVVGTLDENNDIVLTGSLSDGTYTLKYENADGTFTEIGNLVINTDTTVYYSVTNNLTYCANSNSAAQVTEGSAYTATIKANSGHELKTVTVTMGGTNITSSAVSGGSISIASVTGDIVITAVAEEVVEEVKNWIANSQNADGSLFVGTNGEAGYKTNTRFGTSDGGERSGATGIEATGFIPVTINDTLYFKGVTITTSSNETTCWYDSEHNFITGGGSSTSTVFGTMDGSVTSVKISDIKSGAPANNGNKIAYVRISASVIDSNSIITKNQPIE